MYATLSVVEIKITIYVHSGKPIVNYLVIVKVTSVFSMEWFSMGAFLRSRRHWELEVMS